MNIAIRAFVPKDIPAMILIWNEVVAEGIAFPQTEFLDEKTGYDFFAGQSFSGVAVERDTGGITGLYILHPNNVGRCGHISNASYAVKDTARGKGVGKSLVLHSIEKSRELGFRILQFNAVVRTNTGALGLYKKLGFVALGTIPGGFRMKDGSYEDIIPHYYIL